VISLQHLRFNIFRFFIFHFNLLHSSLPVIHLSSIRNPKSAFRNRTLRNKEGRAFK
jgi:hypothetical protein